MMRSVIMLTLVLGCTGPQAMSTFVPTRGEAPDDSVAIAESVRQDNFLPRIDAQLVCAIRILPDPSGRSTMEVLYCSGSPGFDREDPHVGRVRPPRPHNILLKGANEYQADLLTRNLVVDSDLGAIRDVHVTLDVAESDNPEPAADPELDPDAGEEAATETDPEASSTEPAPEAETAPDVFCWEMPADETCRWRVVSFFEDLPNCMPGGTDWVFFRRANLERVMDTIAGALFRQDPVYRRPLTPVLLDQVLFAALQRPNLDTLPTHYEECEDSD